MQKRTFSDILAMLDDVREDGTGYVSLCPAHDDSDPSLRLALNADTGRVLVKCRVGCKLPDVLGKLGLDVAELFDVQPGDLAGIRTTTTEAAEVSPADVAALAVYCDRAADAAAAAATDDARAYAARRFGADAATFTRLGLGYDDGSVDSGSVKLSRERYLDVPRLTVPFTRFDGAVHGLQARALSPDTAVRWSGPVSPEGSAWGKYGYFAAETGWAEVLLVEGPGDAITAAAAGYDSVAIRGAGLGSNVALQVELAEHLRGRRVVVAGDTDDAGQQFTRTVAEALAGHGLDVAALAIPAEVSDLTEWREVNPEAFTQALRAAVAAAETFTPAAAVAVAMPRQRQRADVNRYSVTDTHLSERVAEDYLRGSWCWAAGTGWMRWDGRRWAESSDVAATRAVQVALKDAHRVDAAKAAKELSDAQAAARDSDGDSGAADALKHATAAHDKRLRDINCYLSATKVGNVTKAARGVLEIETDAFDDHPDLLNVGNGVVDLRTGTVGPHLPELYLTKITDTAYVAGAVHDDWARALTSMLPDVAEWVRFRVGQAATGHPPDDDVVPISQGGGNNGKTSIFGGAQAALGDHCVTVPMKLLLSNPNDHSTELTTLHGARMALLEETPESGFLDSQRLKTIAGTTRITARRIQRNNFSWSPTHSLMINTNHEPRVADRDHGTWRRLALVPFPFKFAKANETGDRPANEGLRDRIIRGATGQHEAILSWIVSGAIDWYGRGCILPRPPADVVAATAAWKGKSDILGQYLNEAVEPDTDSAIRSSDLYTDFAEWAKERGYRPWNDQTFWERFKGHELMDIEGVERTVGPQRLGTRQLVNRDGSPGRSPKGTGRFVFGLRFQPRGPDSARGL